MGCQGLGSCLPEAPWWTPGGWLRQAASGPSICRYYGTPGGLKGSNAGLSGYSAADPLPKAEAKMLRLAQGLGGTGAVSGRVAPLARSMGQDGVAAGATGHP